MSINRLHDYKDIKTGAILRLDTTDTSAEPVVEFEVEGTKESVTIELDFDQAKQMAEQLLELTGAKKPGE